MKTLTNIMIKAFLIDGLVYPGVNGRISLF